MTTEHTTTDHAAEARKHLEWVHEWQSYTGDTPETGLADALVAQAHATLALAEQQRISNLVALYTNPSADVATAMEASGVSFSGLIRQIKEGMGLS